MRIRVIDVLLLVAAMTLAIPWSVAALVLEIEGRWPWQAKTEQSSDQ